MPRPLNGGGDGTVASFGYNGTTPEVGIRDISGIEEAVLYADVEDVYIEGVPT